MMMMMIMVIKYWKKNTGLVGANLNPGVVIKYWKKNTGLVGANRNPGVVIKCWKENTGLVGANLDPGVVIKYWKKTKDQWVWVCVNQIIKEGRKEEKRVQDR